MCESIQFGFDLWRWGRATGILALRRAGLPTVGKQVAGYYGRGGPVRYKDAPPTCRRDGPLRAWPVPAGFPPNLRAVALVEQIAGKSERLRKAGDQNADGETDGRIGDGTFHSTARCSGDVDVCCSGAVSEAPFSGARSLATPLPARPGACEPICQDHR